MKKNKGTIRLNETELNQIIKESINNVLSSSYEDIEAYEDQARQQTFKKIDEIKNEVRSLLPSDNFDYSGKEGLEQIVNEICEKLDDLANFIQIDAM